MKVIFKFTFMLLCMLILRQYQRRNNSQIPKKLFKTTKKCQLQDQSHNIGLDIGFIFRGNSVYYGTFLYDPAELFYPMPPENGKVTKRSAKGMSLLPALHLIHIIISYVGLR